MKMTMIMMMIDLRNHSFQEEYGRGRIEDMDNTHYLSYPLYQPYPIYQLQYVAIPEYFIWYGVYRWTT